jgi:hypothetical protein
MLYDAIETVYAVVLANFATDLAALASAKGVTITTTADIIKRQRAETFVAFGKGVTSPAIGIFSIRGLTQAKWQTQRDTDCTVVCDYYARSADPSALAIQAELAAEALLKSMDRIWPTAAGGAGEGDRSVTIEMTDAYVETVSSETETARWEHRAMVTFTVQVRDTGLYE